VRLGDGASTTTAGSDGRVPIAFAAFPEPVSGTVALQTPASRAAPRAKAPAVMKLGSKRFRAAKGRRVVVRVTLPRRGRALLKRRRTLRVTATVTVRDESGNRTVRRFALKIRAAKRR
jgi:hypothetical protein